MDTIENSNSPTLLLSIRNLCVEYRDGNAVSKVVHNVSFDVAQGEVVALVGESGSGKTTIARAVMAMLSHGAVIADGSIRYGDQELIGLATKQYNAIRGKQIGWIPQDPMIALNPLQRIGRQVVEPLRVHGLISPAQEEKAGIGLLQRVGIDQARMRIHQYPYELSGGMRQRVLIAGALAANPRLIIADEPTTALDVTVQKRILDDIESLRGSMGSSMLLITHDLALAAERAHRVIVLRHGEVVEQGRAGDVLRQPQHSYSRLLIDSAPSLASTRLGARPASVAVDVQESPVMTLEGVSKSFLVTAKRGATQQIEAVSDVHLELHAGQTLGLVGESGSGKSTLSRLLLDLEVPSRGRVRFHCKDIATFDKREKRAYRKAVQSVYQNPYASLNPRMSVEELIAEPMLGFGLAARRDRHAQVAKLLDQVGLSRQMGSRYSAALSGGQRQRVAIARALAARPEIIVFDEPVSALDVSVQAQILNLLVQVQQERGLTYLFISHDLAVVRQMADRVAVMKEGRIVEESDADRLYSHPEHSYTRLLLRSVPGAARRDQ